jgi:hypothetical protein
VVLAVSLGVHRLGRLLIRPGVSHNPGRSVLIAVRCVLDEILLRELKALGHASSAFIHRSTLLATARRAIHDRF